jgi:hypothetical protein
MTAHWAFLLLAAGPAAGPVGPPIMVTAPDAASLVAAFSRFCVATGGDRAKFDAEVERAGVRKMSNPSGFSGLEVNRRWAVGKVELAYLDAPSPAGRSCSVSAGIRGGYDGAAIASAVAAAAGTPLRQTELTTSMRVWKAIDARGNFLIINNRFGPYFSETEIILRPAEKAVE